MSYCGNINFWHGVEKLIPILKELSKQRVNYEFYLVGGQEDSYTKNLRQMFKNIKNVEVIESSDPKVLEKYILISDYCFLPVANVRTSPGNPIKLFDYVRLGKRVITQENLPGYSDLLPTNLGHVHVDLDDGTLAGQQLSIEMTKTNIEMEKKIFEYASRNQSWQVVMDRWLNRIEKKLSR